jgi:hypothetical protein
MAIHVVTEYRRTPGARLADRIRSVPLGAVLVVLAAAGFVAAAWNPTAVLGGSPELAADRFTAIGILAGAGVIGAVTGVPMLTVGLPRRLAIVVGFVLLPVVAFAFLGGIAGTWGIFAPMRFSRSQALIRAAVLWAIFFALAWFARRLIRGSRHLCLFLRKFGFSEATSQVSDVVRSDVGSTWRAVTLDDSRVTSVGTASRYWYRTWVLGGGLTLLASLICTAGYWIASPASRHGVGYAFCMMLVLVPIVTFFGAWLSGDHAYYDAKVPISGDDAVAPAVGRILRRDRRILAPRMVVCRVSDPQWKATVRALAQHADAVLVDLSRPSDAVVWELSTLREIRATNCVYVCHASTVATLASADPADPSLTGQVARLLDDVDVLVYGTADDASFGPSLRNRLNDAALSRR